MTDKPDIPDIAPATVAHDGNLRDRIAYALAQADGDEPGMEPASCDYELADAVIAELGLRQETTYAWKNGRTYPAGIRYATKWEKP